jgi:acid stress chaperone HdeB
VPRKSLLISGFVLMVALNTPLEAQVTIDVSKIDCDQYVHSKITTPNYIAAWISGYYSAKQNNTVLDPQDMHEKIGKLENYCYEEKNFKVPVMKAVEDLFGKGKGRGKGKR